MVITTAKCKKVPRQDDGGRRIDLMTRNKLTIFTFKLLVEIEIEMFVCDQLTDQECCWSVGVMLMTSG